MDQQSQEINSNKDKTDNDIINDDIINDAIFVVNGIKRILYRSSEEDPDKLTIPHYELLKKLSIRLDRAKEIYIKYNDLLEQINKIKEATNEIHIVDGPYSITTKIKLLMQQLNQCRTENEILKGEIEYLNIKIEKSKDNSSMA